MMHGTYNVKLINAQQTKRVHKYIIIKEKLYKCNAAIWYNKTFQLKYLTPRHINRRINGNNTQCKKTKSAAIHFRIKKSFLCSYCCQTYRHECTNRAVQLIKCCPWWWTNDSPKHVEPFNEKIKIKIIHKNWCISLVYKHIAIWCTVHTTSNGSHCTFNFSVYWSMFLRVQSYL